MLSFSVKSMYTLLCLLCLADTHGDLIEKAKSINGKRMNSLVQYITQKAAKHQVMIIIDEESADQGPKMYDFIRKINWHVPTLIMTVNQAEDSNGFHKHIGEKPRETTLFLIITFSDVKALASRLNSPFGLLSKMSTKYTRTKYLIVHFSEGRDANYDSLLKMLWRKKFLDVTVLQVADTTSASMKLIPTRRISALHQYNPYSKTYTIRKSWLTSHWFPDKGINLHKSRVKLLRTRPLSIRIRQFHGTMSQKLNYSILYSKRMGRSIVRFLKEKAQITSHMKQYFHTNKQKNYHYSRICSLSSFRIIVPKIKVPITMKVLTWNFICALLLNVLLVVLLRLLLMVLKFDSDSWQMLYIGSLILGMGLPNVSTNIKERIVLCCLLLTCMVYSGFFHSMLTDVEFQATPYKEINSIEELAMSSLPLRTNANFLLKNNKDQSCYPDYISKLKNKTAMYKPGYKQRECLNDLNTYKNVTCTMTLEDIEQRISFRRKRQQKIEMKIVDETLTYGGVGFITEHGFPIVDNFNKKLVRFVDVGLMSKWRMYHSYLRTIPNEEPIVESQSSGLLLRILIFLALGYSSSLALFMGEVLWDFYNRRWECRVIDLRKRKEQKNRWLRFRKRAKKCNPKKLFGSIFTPMVVKRLQRGRKKKS